MATKDGCSILLAFFVYRTDINHTAGFEVVHHLILNAVAKIKQSQHPPLEFRIQTPVEVQPKLPFIIIAKDAEPKIGSPLPVILLNPSINAIKN